MPPTTDHAFEHCTAYPLAWPTGWPRAKSRRRASFGHRGRGVSLARATEETYRQLGRMGVPDWQTVISTNVELRLDGLPYSNRKTPDDPGVAVYFRLGDDPRVLACDTWDTVEDNLWAVTKHLDALRGIDRWGVGSIEQAFSGYAAIPASAGGAGWWSVLGIERDGATPEAISSAFRTLALQRHPDHGGDGAAMAELNDARSAALRELNDGGRRDG